MSFYNASPIPVQILWLDYEGNEVRRTCIARPERSPAQSAQETCWGPLCISAETPRPPQVSYGRLRPDAAKSVTTFANHPWIIREVATLRRMSCFGRQVACITLCSSALALRNRLCTMQRWLCAGDLCWELPPHEGGNRGQHQATPAAALEPGNPCCIPSALPARCHRDAAVPLQAAGMHRLLRRVCMAHACNCCKPERRPSP